MSNKVENRTAVYVRRVFNSRDSIEEQINAIKEYCTEKNYNIVDLYIDNSGGTVNLFHFLRMIKDSKENLFDVVIVDSMNRFGSNESFLNRRKKILIENGVRIESVK